MRIGLDIDDTTGYFSASLIDYAKAYDKTIRNTGIVNPDKYIIKGMFDWTPEETIAFDIKYIQIVASIMKVKEGAKEIIDQLRALGYEIYFITARNTNHYQDPLKTTTDWLAKNDIKYDKLIINAYDKIDVCKKEKIDIYMDDIASICDKVMNLGIKTYLVDTIYNKYYDNPKVTRVHNWKEFYDYVIKDDEDGKI